MRDTIAQTMQVDYPALARALESVVPKSRVAADPLRTLCYGTDASFYRLIPQLVVTVESEAEVIGVLGCCARAGAPVTFRAAGHLAVRPGDHRQRPCRARRRMARLQDLPTTAPR